MIVGKQWYLFWLSQSVFLDISGSQIHVSELQVATAAQSYNLAPWYEFSLV